MGGMENVPAWRGRTFYICRRPATYTKPQDGEILLLRSSDAQGRTAPTVHRYGSVVLVITGGISVSIKLSITSGPVTASPTEG